MTKITAFGTAGDFSIPAWVFFHASAGEGKKVIRGPNLYKITLTLDTPDGDKVNAVLAITGTDFKYGTHHQPIAGTATHITISTGGDLNFTYENFSAPLKALHDAFSNDDFVSGNFEALDKIFSFFGNINYFGSPGRDNMLGSTGRDHFIGEGSSDTFFGFDNNDTLSGGSGSDSLNGGFGADKIIGDSGLDTIFGGGGNDNLSGGIDDDSINGGTGNDTIGGGDGSDTILGFFRNDRISGGLGNDSIDGGSGIDTVAYLSNAGSIDLSSSDGGRYHVVAGVDDTDDLDSIEKVIGSNLTDTMSGSDIDDNFAGQAGKDALIGHEGNDTLSGGTGSDTIDGGEANDSVNGGADADTLSGGDGRDTVFGGSGADTVDGGTGNDSIAAGSENDSVSGGDGNDSIISGPGADTLSGGTGADHFFITGALSADGDVIIDFVSKVDHIDLSRIDTRPGVPNDQPFHFIGADPFSGARGELQVVTFSVGGGPLMSVIKGDVDGNGTADFTITSTGPAVEGDFIL